MTDAHPIRILLVDDSESDRTLAALGLRRFKVANELVTAEDAEAALVLLADDTQPLPDLILLDLNMPGMGGLEFLRVVKANEQYRSIPVIIMTSSTMEEDIAAAYNSYCSGYIRKPVNMAAFTKIVATIESYWFVIVRRPSRTGRRGAAAKGNP